MAAQYYLYCTTLNNTVINRSDSSFAPLPPNTGELYYDILIPQTQPLYLYRESGSTIIHNTQEYVDDYINATELPPTSQGNVTYGEFTGTTAVLSASIGNLNSSKVDVSGDTMTGSLSTTANLTAIGAVTGSTICGGVWVHSPFVCASTKVQSPIITGSTCSIAPITIGSTCVCSPRILGSVSICSPIVSGSTCVTGTISCATTRMQSPIVCGSTCVTSPITCGTTCVISPIVLGSTCVCSPTVCTSTCLCSTGTARFTGAVTDASTLNVSGATRLAGALTALSTLNVSGNTTLSATARSVTPATTDCSTCIATTAYMRNYLNTLSGGSTNYYYTECTAICSTTLGTCVKYLGWTGTSLSAGRYQIDVTEQVGQASANKAVCGKITFDGVEQGSIFQLQMNVTNFTFANTLSRDVTWGAGTHCVDTYYWAGAGTACATFGSIRIKKLY
jgi:hypothetical protein